MVTKKDLIIAVLVTFCLTVTIFMIMPIKSANNPYDPMLDSNHDGKISLADLVALANTYGTTGDPTLNVTIVPLSNVSWIYAVPFIVSNAIFTHPSSFGVGPGVYETDILVHNPEAFYLNITKKIVVANPENSSFIEPIFLPPVYNFPPDGAFRIDSDEIYNYTLPPFHPPGFTYPAKGFVGIISKSPNLDVVAFYTVSESIYNPNLFGSVPTPGNTTSIETLTITPKPYYG
jgi:hypothetical protein